MNIVKGRYIEIEELNVFFAHVRTMLLSHYDTEEYAGITFILGTYSYDDMATIRARHPGRKIIVIQLESIIDGTSWQNPDRTVPHMIGADEIWDYDANNVKALWDWYKVKVDRVIKFEYTKELDKKLYEGPEDIDVLFYGMLSPRRSKVMFDLHKSLYGMARIACIWGFIDHQLDDYIRRAKILLNLHAFEGYGNRQEITRMFYAVINGKCVLSEPSEINHLEGMIVECREVGLMSTIRTLLDNDFYREFGLSARGTFMKGGL
jgi:hypothetical protein